MGAGESTINDIREKIEHFPPLREGNSLGRNWCAWKQKLLSFLQEENVCKDQWTQILWMVIGPTGDRAARTVRPRNGKQEQDFELLLRNLDIYFIFGSRKKRNDESFDQYIDSLTRLVALSKHNDPDSVIKNKLVQDISNTKDTEFTQKAMDFIQFRGHLQRLNNFMSNVNGIIKFVTQVQEIMQPHDNSSASNSTETECICCGTRHGRNRCPAYDQQCNRCKNYNHFSKYCKTRYVRDCHKCGTSHYESRCPAYNLICEKCDKTDHFSQLCTYVKDCPRCSRDHAASECPAKNKICPLCNKRNHFQNKCPSFY